MRLRPPRPLLLAAGAFAPGALGGVHLAGLLFFLNPDLPFAFGPLLRGFTLYGCLLGAASLLVQAPLLLRHPAAAKRLLPWALTAAFAAAALLDWTHASYYAYFLPTGINQRLIKTAIWLSVATLLSFYTALLHSLAPRRYGWRSRYGLAFLSLLSVFVMVERRAAYHRSPEPLPRPSAVELGSRPRLWVIGLDTATLDAILPLAGQGRLPFLARVLKEGAYGRLDSLSPTHAVALWISLATGKFPWRHGVTGGRLFGAGLLAPGAELRLLPVGIGFWRWGLPGGSSRLARAYPRGALTLWEILPRLGVPAGVVSWPASSPASREAIFALSDRFFTERNEPGNAWPPAAAARASGFRPNLRRHGKAVLAPFGPPVPAPVIDALEGDLWRQSLAANLVEEHPSTGALFLVLPGLRHVSRRYFGGFSAVQFDANQAQDARAAAERIAAYYSALDTYLGELWEQERGERLLAVVSAYGVEGSSGWRRLLSSMSRKVALEGYFNTAPDGVLLLYGDGIQPGALITGARVVDVAPTLLYALGFPLARDLDGQVLTAAFDKRFLSRHPLDFLPSYEGLEVPPGR